MNYFAKDDKGEICFRGAAVMKGYLNDPDLTAKTIDKEVVRLIILKIVFRAGCIQEILENGEKTVDWRSSTERMLYLNWHRATMFHRNR